MTQSCNKSKQLPDRGVGYNVQNHYKQRVLRQYLIFCDDIIIMKNDSMPVLCHLYKSQANFKHHSGHTKSQNFSPIEEPIISNADHWLQKRTFPLNVRNVRDLRSTKCNGILYMLQVVFWGFTWTSNST